jgi:alpha-1,2-mannosyltransferase
VRTSSASTEPVEADRRWLPVGVATAVAGTALGLGNIARIMVSGIQWNMLDLGVYRWGGEQARLGGDLYGSLFPASETVIGYGGGDLPFTYTPVSALLFIPLSWVSFTVAQPLMVLVDVAALAVIVSVSLRSLGYRPGPGRLGMTLTFTTAAVVLEPVLETIGFGQINLVLVALCLWDLCLPDDHPAKGVGIGLATAVKLTPAIFIAFLGITGRWRPAGRAVASAAGAWLLAFAVLPEASTRFWFGGVFGDATRVGSLDFAGNQSLNGLLTRLLGEGTGTKLLWLVLVAAVGLGGLVAAARLHRRGDPLAAIVLVALTGLLVSPISWTHHWVWIVPSALIVVDAVLRGVPRAGWLLAVLLAAFVAPGIIRQVPQDGGRERQWNALQVAAGNLYVWLGLALLAAAAVVTARSAPRTAPRDPASPAPAGSPGGWPTRGAHRSPPAEP